MKTYLEKQIPQRYWITNFKGKMVEKIWSIKITVFLYISLLHALLALGSFQHHAGEDCLYDGIYF